MGEKAGAFHLEAETLAQSRAAQARDRAGGSRASQNERIGQQALDGARIDVGLIRDLAATSDPAPIAHQKMRILVLHATTSLCPGTEQIVLLGRYEAGAVPAPPVTLKSHEGRGKARGPALRRFTLSFRQRNQVPAPSHRGTGPTNCPISAILP